MLSAHKHLISFGILRRHDEGSGFGRDADGSQVVGGREAYLGLWHARGDGQEARIRRIRRADILGNTGADPIGPSLKISPLSASVSKLKADIIIAFQQDPREFLLIMNSDVSLLQHRQKLIKSTLVDIF
jgi:hypothetical protein